MNRMHLHNIELGERGSPEHVSQFGFPVATFCGQLVQGNQWRDDWPVSWKWPSRPATKCAQGLSDCLGYPVELSEFTHSTEVFSIEVTLLACTL